MFIILASILLFASTVQPGDTCKQWKDTLTGRVIYMDADTRPECEGGEVALMRRLDKALKVPKSASSYEMQTTYEVAFIVETNGKISGGRVINGNKNQIAKQLLDVIKSCRWYPGKCHGKKVPMLVKRPFIIDLQTD